MSTPPDPNARSADPGTHAAPAPLANPQRGDPAPTVASGPLAFRCLIGGLLMGIANIVPGISGGAMLLLTGVYTAFLTALANLSSLRWRIWRSWLVVGFVGSGAMTSIVLLAGPTLYLIVNFRFQVYCVLIGMRLGVIPTVWSLAKKSPGRDTSLWAGAAVGVVLTSAAAVFKYNPDLVGELGSHPATLFLGGLLAASATILPGLDGSYLLMLLGQYNPVLKAISDAKDAAFKLDVAGVWQQMGTLVPFGLGALIGIGGVALLLRWLFDRFPKPTFGLLLGVLVGAFVGLYPFGSYVQPMEGQRVRGEVVTGAMLAPGGKFGPDERHKWPVRFSTPSTSELAAALGLIVLGFGAALALTKLDPEERNMPRT
jgi:putative membrane protein